LLNHGFGEVIGFTDGGASVVLKSSSPGWGVTILKTLRPLGFVVASEGVGIEASG
jgi:hypothetical protein